MTPEDVNRFINASRTGKLSSRDRKFINSFNLSPDELLADMNQDMSAHNQKELAAAIAGAPSPEVRNILVQEQKRIVEQIRNLNNSDLAKSSQQEKEDPSVSIFRIIGDAIQNLWSK